MTYHYVKFIGWMDNMDIAVRATTMALDSQGSAMQENGIFMEGLGGKLNSLKARVEEFWASTSTQDALNNIIDGLTKVMEVVNVVAEHIDILSAAITLATVGFVIFNATAITAVITALMSLIPWIVMATSSFAGLNAVLTVISMHPVLVLVAITLAIGGGIIAWNAYKRSIENASEAEEKAKLEKIKLLNESQKLVDTMQGEITNVEKLIEEYNKLNGKVNKSTEEKKKLSDLETSIIKVMPILIGFYDSEGKAHLKNSKAIELEIAAKKRLAFEGQKALKDQYLEKVVTSSKRLKEIPAEKKSIQQDIAQYEQFPVGHEFTRIEDGNVVLKTREVLLEDLKKQLKAITKENDDLTKSFEEGRKYVALGNATYDALGLAARNVADELINMIPKTDDIKVYDNAVNSVMNNIKKFGLEAKMTKYDELNQQYKEGKITIKELDTAYDALKETLTKLGLGDVIDKFVQLDKTHIEFATRTEAVDKAVTSLSNEVKDYNGVLVTLEKNELVAQETMLTMMQKYPEFAAKVTVVNGKLTIESNALKAVKEARINAGIEGIKAEANLTTVVQRELLKRLSNYGIEVKALKTRAQMTEALTGAEKKLYQARVEAQYGSGGMTMTTDTTGKEIAPLTELRSNIQEYIDAYDYIESLKKSLKSGDPYYGTTPEKDKKDTGGGTDKNVNDKLLELDRYMELNLALERTNTLIAQNKALQENATIQQKIKLMEIEIKLMEQKQRNLAAIAKEEREERGELVTWLTKNAKAKFSGSGDTMSIANAPAFLEAKRVEVNAHKDDKDAEGNNDDKYYKKINQEYTILQEKVKRFNEIQVNGITDMQQQWMAALKIINDEIANMRGLKIEMMFAPVLADISDFDEAMKQIGFDEALAAKDTVKLAKVKEEKIGLLTNQTIKLTTDLDRMNKVTDKATLADERFIKAKRDLINTLQQTTTALIEETTALEEEKKSSVESTEKSIIEMIKKGLELKKKLLKDELDNYKTYVDDFLKEKDRQYASEDYEKEIGKETQTKQQIQAQIDALAGDTSIEAFQKVRELKKQLTDQNDKIDTAREKRRRDLEKDNMQQSLTTKEKEFEETSKLLDFVYSEEYIKKLAHETLVNQSFDRMRKQFPELFKQLGVDAQTGFFDVFEKYELTFGETIIGYAERFEKEILPKLQQAVDTVNGIKTEMAGIDQKLKGTDYSKVVFDPNRNYQKDLNELASVGITPESDKGAEQILIEKYAKMYAEPQKYAAQIAMIPEKYQKQITTPAKPESGQAISGAISTLGEDKITKPVTDQYTRVEKATEIAKQEIGRLQKLYMSVKGKTKADEDLKTSYKNAANTIRGKSLLGLTNDKGNYIDYQSYIPQSSLDQLGVKVLNSFSKGVQNGLVTDSGLYMLHGSETKPEWVFTNAQLMNLVKNLSSGVNLPSRNNPNIAGAGAGGGYGDISLNINIAGNADKDAISQIKEVGKGILLDIKKQMNKNGVYR